MQIADFQSRPLGPADLLYAIICGVLLGTVYISVYDSTNNLSWSFLQQLLNIYVQ